MEGSGKSTQREQSLDQPQLPNEGSGNHMESAPSIPNRERAQVVAALLLAMELHGHPGVDHAAEMEREAFERSRNILGYRNSISELYEDIASKTISSLDDAITHQSKSQHGLSDVPAAEIKASVNSSLGQCCNETQAAKLIMDRVLSKLTEGPSSTVMGYHIQQFGDESKFQQRISSSPVNKQNSENAPTLEKSLRGQFGTVFDQYNSNPIVRDSTKISDSVTNVPNAEVLRDVEHDKTNKRISPAVQTRQIKTKKVAAVGSNHKKSKVQRMTSANKTSINPFDSGSYPAQKSTQSPLIGPANQLGYHGQQIAQSMVYNPFETISFSGNTHLHGPQQTSSIERVNQAQWTPRVSQINQYGLENPSIARSMVRLGTIPQGPIMNQMYKQLPKNQSSINSMFTGQHPNEVSVFVPQEQHPRFAANMYLAQHCLPMRRALMQPQTNALGDYSRQMHINSNNRVTSKHFMCSTRYQCPASVNNLYLEDPSRFTEYAHGGQHPSFQSGHQHHQINQPPSGFMFDTQQSAQIGCIDSRNLGLKRSMSFPQHQSVSWQPYGNKQLVDDSANSGQQSVENSQLRSMNTVHNDTFPPFNYKYRRQRIKPFEINRLGDYVESKQAKITGHDDDEMQQLVHPEQTPQRETDLSINLKSSLNHLIEYTPRKLSSKNKSESQPIVDGEFIGGQYSQLGYHHKNNQFMDELPVIRSDGKDETAAQTKILDIVTQMNHEHLFADDTCFSSASFTDKAGSAASSTKLLASDGKKQRFSDNTFSDPQESTKKYDKDTIVSQSFSDPESPWATLADGPLVLNSGNALREFSSMVPTIEQFLDRVLKKEIECQDKKIFILSKTFINLLRQRKVMSAGDIRHAKSFLKEKLIPLMAASSIPLKSTGKDLTALQTRYQELINRPKQSDGHLITSTGQTEIMDVADEKEEKSRLLKISLRKRNKVQLGDAKTNAKRRKPEMKSDN